MAKRKRTGSQPKGLGRGERGDRRSNRQPKVERTESAWQNTGVFCQPAPELKGVSDYVRVSNRDMARRAKREMSRWQRTLPKGVKV